MIKIFYNIISSIMIVETKKIVYILKGSVHGFVFNEAY